MAQTLTRQALYDRVWSTPMTKLAAELGTTNGLLKGVCRKAAIPTPPSGYWMKKEFGKPAVPEPLGPPPTDLVDPLTIGPAVAPKAKAERSAEKPSDSSPNATPKPDDRAEQPPQALPPRPTMPTRLTREALYEAVWREPMSRLASTYGVSGNGLAKICAKADVPCPPRGYWARLAAGKPAERPPLSPAGEHTPRQIIIRPTPAPQPAPELPPEVAELAAAARASATVPVSERLLRPHPVIARWLADHDERKRRARRERDPWMKKLTDPGDFSDTDHRRHRLLDALFKSLERNKAQVKQDDRNQLFVETLGERIEFQLREKHKQGRRPLTADEQRWRLEGDKDWKQELLPTGRLVFEIKTRLPDGLRAQWLETDDEPLEDSIPDIVASFVAGGPLLVKQRQAREEAERQRQIAERLRYEEQQRRKQDANRWRRFTELAHDWRDLAVAREFLAALRAMEADPAQMIDGRSIQEWIGWAEERLKLADPLADGVEGVFAAVASVREWTYRD